MWGVTWAPPWTRDATVRGCNHDGAQGRGAIVELHVVDNGYVRKGDLLMVIDPTNYTIAVMQAEAAVQQTEASVQNIDAQIAVEHAQISANEAQLDGARAALAFVSSRRGATRSREGRLGHRSE